MNDLEFKDYRTDFSKDDEITINEGQYCLFVEKLYGVTDDKNINDAIKEFLSDKAKKLNCLLVYGNPYWYFSQNFIDDSFKRVTRYVQINKSKNGRQYMDSLSGSTEAVNNLSYPRADVFLLKQKEKVQA